MASFSCLLPLTLLGFQATDADLSKQARGELYAARYEKAAELYRTALAQSPSPDDYYYLTRALLNVHRAKDAYATADEALNRTPHTAGAETAAGLALFRNGDLSKADEHFREAVRLDPKYPGALAGLATIYSALSKSATARDVSERAFAASPDDPILMLAHANRQTGPPHLEGLEMVLKIFDPASAEARNIRRHIASDRAYADRKLRRLVTPYEPALMKLTPVMEGTRLRGYALKVQFNKKSTLTLLLDTASSGIRISPRSAEKAGLELIDEEPGKATGFGDQKPQDSFSYLAAEVNIGGVVFADFPVSAYRNAKSADFDRFIGTGVFSRFMVTLDMPGLRFGLEPMNSPTDGPRDAPATEADFHRVLRIGSSLLIATSVNDGAGGWFLIDTAWFSNVIDTERAKQFTKVKADFHTRVHGAQGNIDKVSRANKVTLAFAGLSQENSNLLAVSLEDRSDALGFGMTGIIGIPMLSHLKLTIDYAAGAVRFEKP